MDRLEEIFKMQDELNSHLGWSQEKALKGREYAPEMINKFLDAIIAECIEVKEALGPEHGYKIWKDKSKSLEGIREEIMDIGFFWITNALFAGMNEDDVYKAYKDKHAKNMVRRDWDVNNT